MVYYCNSQIVCAMHQTTSSYLLGPHVSNENDIAVKSLREKVYAMDNVSNWLSVSVGEIYALSTLLDTTSNLLMERSSENP